MPNLPTLFVTDAQANRMLGAFGSADNYKAWLKEQIIAYVLDAEERADYAAWQAARQAKNNQTRTDLS